jgi:serine-type D-Ala-D-Ala carboxypeptidase (penicillin-binding protein 5/6)
MRLFRLISSIVAILLVSVVVSPAVVGASPAMPEVGSGRSHLAPELSARSSIAIDLTSGLQLHAHDADVRVAPASTVKLTTLLVARQILDPQELITIVEADLYLGEEYSQMGLVAGDVATVESLLYGSMLMSGADSSLALARVAGQRLDPGTGDPVGRFVQEMNAFAQNNRMYATNFVDPVGADYEQQYTTARDLVRVMHLVLDDWLLRQVGATPEIVVTVGGPQPREMYLYSTNRNVLTGDSIGGKTGTTDSAGECLVNVTTRGDHIIVTVVMGSIDRFYDTDMLMQSITERFRFVVLGAGTSVPGVEEDLASHGLRFPVGSTVIMTPEQLDLLDYDLLLAGNRSPNGRAGVVVFRLGDREILRMPVHAVS